MNEKCNVLSAVEAAEYLGISLWLVRQRTRRGDKDPIPCVRLGKRVLFYRDVLDEWRQKKAEESMKPDTVQQNYGKLRQVTP